MFEKLPDGQATQGVAGLLSKSTSPLTQSEHVVDPSAAYVPAGQSMQPPAVWPVAVPVENRPAVQSTHAVRSAFCSLPGVHAVQV